ncbi:MAG: branched-chain amino acid ABC transporter permease [Nitrososphaerales archaeon]
MSTLLAEYLLFGASISATWILIASGFTLLYGVTKIVNVAYGLSYALSAYLFYYLVRVVGLSAVLALPLAIIIAVLVDLALFTVLIRPIMENHELTITATFLLVIAMTQVFMLLFSPQPRGVPTIVEGNISIFGVNMVLQRFILVPTSVLALLLLHIFLRKTRAGKAIRAASQDSLALRLLGLSVQKYYLLTLMISSTLASLAGVLFVSLEVVTPTTILDPIVPIFTVTILGGLGSIPGAILAGLLLGYSETAAIYIFGSQLRGIIPLIIAILAIQIRPYGILGRK